MCLFLLVLLQSPPPHIWDLTLADRAVGGPLAQWLTVVALKVWYLLACRSMRPTNLTLSPCWEIDRKSKERGKEKDKYVIVRDDGVGRERGQVSGGFLTHFSPRSPLLPQSPPWLQRVSDRSPCYHSLHCWAALERCDQAGGSQLSFCYSFSSSAIAFALFPPTLSPSISSPRSVSICKSWGWLKYLQAFGQFNLENICDRLTSNNSLTFSEFFPPVLFKISLPTFAADSSAARVCFLFPPIHSLLIVRIVNSSLSPLSDVTGNRFFSFAPAKPVGTWF